MSPIGYMRESYLIKGHPAKDESLTISSLYLKYDLNDDICGKTLPKNIWAVSFDQRL